VALNIPSDSAAHQHMTQIENDEIDLGQLARTLWRGKFLILLAAIVGLLIGGWYAYFQAVPVYTSTATVALEDQQAQVVDIESVVSGVSSDQASINTEIEVIRSRSLLEKLVTRLNLLEDPEFNASLRPQPKFSVGVLIKIIKSVVSTAPAATPTVSERRNLDSVIDVVLSKISVSNIRQSYVFRITATTQQAQKSAEIANTLAELYILEQLETKFQATEQATTWLTQRVAELQVQLEAAEAEVKDFNASAELVSAEALTGLNRQIKDLRDRLRETKASKAAFDQRLTDLELVQSSSDFSEIAAIANDQTLDRVVQLMLNSGDANPDRRSTNRGSFKYDRRARAANSKPVWRSSSASTAST
jgi:succinoglycan biosynthesis transport protein ExoP